MNITLKEDTDQISSRLRCLEKLKNTTVDVGLPEDASSRSRFLLALHERGSPIMHIPPRPVVGPGLSQARDEMAAALAAGCEAAAAGDESGLAAAFNSAGEAGVQSIRNYIDAGIPPPNAPVTVSGGWIFNRVARVGVHVSGKGFNKPLYDTGELYNSFGYEVKEK